MKISQLEAVTKADVLEKNELLDKLSQERGTFRFLAIIVLRLCFLEVCLSNRFYRLHHKLSMPLRLDRTSMELRMFFLVWYPLINESSVKPDVADVLWTCLPDENEKVQAELKELRVNFYSQKELCDDLSDKMKFFSRVIRVLKNFITSCEVEAQSTYFLLTLSSHFFHRLNKTHLRYLPFNCRF